MSKTTFQQIKEKVTTTGKTSGLIALFMLFIMLQQAGQSEGQQH